MRKVFVLATLVLLLAVLSLPVKSSPDESYDVGVRRVVTIGEWGAVVFNDTIRIVNSGSTTVSNINYAIPRSMAANLREILAKDSSGFRLSIERDVETSAPFYWTRVNLRDPVPPKGTGSLYISSAYANLVTFLKATSEIGSEDKFAVSLPAFPTL